MRKEFAVLVLLLLAAACGSDSGAASLEPVGPFGSVDGPIADLVGTEVKANGVVDLPCIPSRRDPIGMWIALRIESVSAGADSFTIGLRQSDARFGSHPSGCSAPNLLFAQSVFLLGGGDPVFVAHQAMADDVTVLEFKVPDGALDQHTLVILPTFRYTKADGTTETSVFGRVGRYSLASE